MQGHEHSFHLTFADGSNPYYHFPCSLQKHRRELRRWRMNYDLELVSKSGNLEFYTAKRRVRP